MFYTSLESFTNKLVISQRTSNKRTSTLLTLFVRLSDLQRNIMKKEIKSIIFIKQAQFILP